MMWKTGVGAACLVTLVLLFRGPSTLPHTSVGAAAVDQASVELPAPPKTVTGFNEPVPDDKVSSVIDDGVTETAFAVPVPDVPVVPDVSEPLPEERTLFVTGSSVNLRLDATATSRKIGKLTRGTQVYVLDERKGWFRIAVSADKAITGWMSADFLAEVQPVSLIPAPEPPPRERSIAAPTSAEIAVARKMIIKQSLESYAGSCPCPYNYDRAGRRCGKRSAYSKPGGYSPICYDSDVSEQRLASFFARQRGATN